MLTALPHYDARRIRCEDNETNGDVRLGDQAVAKTKVTRKQHRTALDAPIQQVVTLLDSLPGLREAERAAVIRRINATILSIARLRDSGARVYVNDERVEQLVENARRKLNEQSTAHA
jgi:hypothetical protein